MASPVIHSPFFSLSSNRNPLKHRCYLTTKVQTLTQQKPQLHYLRKRTSTVLCSSLQDQQQEEKSSPPPSSVAVAPSEEAETRSNHELKNSDLDEAQKEQQQEVDWKEDEEFKKFMGNPSIEAALELEKKRVNRRIKEMERETDGGNPVQRLWNNLVRNRLEGEKERLEKAKEITNSLLDEKSFLSLWRKRQTPLSQFSL